jgi:hypothetical protein
VDRFALTDNSKDLDAAIECCHKAISAARLMSQRHLWLLDILSRALNRRYQTAADLADLEAAMRFARQSARMTPRRKQQDLSRRWARFDTYAFERYEHSGDLADLEAAIDGGRKALSAIPRNDPLRARRLGNLALNLNTRFELSQHPGDLGQALQLARAGSPPPRQAPPNGRSACALWPRSP